MLSPARRRFFAPLAILAAALAPLSACAVFQRMAAAAFERPRLTFQSWTIEALEPDGLTLVLDYALENPNSASFRLLEATYDLELEGKRAADGEITKAVDIPGHATVPFHIPVRVRFEDLPTLLDLLGSPDSLRYRVTGKARVDTPGGRMELPFEHQDRLALPR